MKITPTAIRQKTFESSFRGYEKKDVTLFLEEVAEVVDQLHKENIELKSKLQNTEMEAKRLKDVEDSLFKTLKTAEDTGASIIEEANEAADQIIGEANQAAEKATKDANEMYQSAISKAQAQADLILGSAEKKAQETIVNLQDNMSDLVRSYEGLAEQREGLVKSLRRITQDSLNQIDLSEAHFSRLDAKAYKRAIEDLSRSNMYTVSNLEKLEEENGVKMEEEPQAAESEVENSVEVEAPQIEEPIEPTEELKASEKIKDETVETVQEEEPIIEEQQTQATVSEEEVEKEEEVVASNEEEEQRKKEVKASVNPEADKDSSQSFFDNL